ncbi:MAG: hypothetical protein ACXW2I_06475 [Burkholderiales bacterium]
MTYAGSIASSVVPYEPADHAALRRFQSEYFGADSRQCDDAFCDWLLKRNPHRQANEPVLWICKRDGLVVGQQVRIPVALKVGDLQYRAAWGIDLMVHREWRLRGVGPALLETFARSTDPALGLGIDEGAYRMCRRLGWVEIATLPLLARPLDPRACEKAFAGPKLAAKLAPKLLVSGSAALAARLLGTFTRVRLEGIPSFDESVDAVWRRSKNDYEVLVTRDFESIRWRFDDVPARNAYRRFYLKRGPEVIGYCVIRLASWHGHVSATVIDYLTERRWLPALLGLTIHEGSRLGAAVVFLEQLHSSAEPLLPTLGCIRVRRSKRFMLDVHERASPMAHTLRQPGNWFVTPADSDFDHIEMTSQNQP